MSCKANDLQSNSLPDGTSIESVSRFLSKVLRHTPSEYGLRLNARGWVSLKEVGLLLEDEFAVDNGKRLAADVVDADENNRFQLQFEDDSPYGFIRATRGHTCDDVDLLAVQPDDEELSTYHVSTGDYAWYVEAVSSDAAFRVLRERANLDIDRDNVDIGEMNGEVYYEEKAYKPSVTDSLSGSSPPFAIYHQDGQKHFMVEKRGNMGGDKGRYFKPHPKRVRERMPPSED